MTEREQEKLAMAVGSLIERVRKLEWERSMWNACIGMLRHEPKHPDMNHHQGALCGADKVTLCYPANNGNVNCPFCLALRSQQSQVG